mgnify:CR=1 FL=1
MCGAGGDNSSNDSGGGGGGDNDDKPAKKKKNIISASPNEQGQKKEPKAKAPKAKAKAPKINYEGNGNQRANLPSEVNKPVRPATPIKSKAKTTPVATAKITQPQIKEERPSGTLRDGLATNKIKTTMGIETDGYGVNQSGFAGPNEQGQKPLVKVTIPKPAKPAKVSKPFDNKGYKTRAAENKNTKIPSLISLAIKDKYRNDEVSYNQAYWATKKAGGATPDELQAEMNKVGMKKAYSGDRVVTKANADTAAFKLKKLTGSMATLQNGGVTKTQKTSGLLGEKKDTTYDYKRGPKVVTRATDPVIKGVRLGEKKSTTYVDGVEYATKTGHDPLGRDAKVTRPETAGHITDRVKIPVKAKKAKVATGGGSGPSQDTALAGGAAALATNQPDNLKNILAIKKNAQRQGKRKLRLKRNTSVGFGNGGVGLNITT